MKNIKSFENYKRLNEETSIEDEDDYLRLFLKDDYEFDKIFEINSSYIEKKYNTYDIYLQKDEDEWIYEDYFEKEGDGWLLGNIEMEIDGFHGSIIEDLFETFKKRNENGFEIIEGDLFIKNENTLKEFLFFANITIDHSGDYVDGDTVCFDSDTFEKTTIENFHDDYIEVYNHYDGSNYKEMVLTTNYNASEYNEVTDDYPNWSIMETIDSYSDKYQEISFELYKDDNGIIIFDYVRSNGYELSYYRDKSKTDYTSYNDNEPDIDYCIKIAVEKGLLETKEELIETLKFPGLSDIHFYNIDYYKIIVVGDKKNYFTEYILMYGANEIYRFSNTLDMKKIEEIVHKYLEFNDGKATIFSPM